MNLMIDDAGLITSFIQVLGIRVDQKDRKWVPTIYNGVPYTGDSDSSDKSSKAGHFVYRCTLANPKACRNGTSVGVAYNVIGSHQKQGEIVFSFDGNIQLLEMMMNGEIIQGAGTIVVSFILEKTGKYVYAIPVDSTYQYTKL